MSIVVISSSGLMRPARTSEAEPTPSRIASCFSFVVFRSFKSIRVILHPCISPEQVKSRAGFTKVCKEYCGSPITGIGVPG